MPKGTSVTSNSEKIQPVALAVIKLCLTGISQAARQSVRRKFRLMIFKKIHGNFLKVFRVDLKACLGLVLPIPPQHHLRKLRLF